EDLPKLLPEVDVFMGIDQVSSITDIVETALARRRSKLAARLTTAPQVPKLTSRARSKSRIAGPLLKTPAASPSTSLVNVTARPSYIPDYATPRFRLTPRHFAYVKIA